MGSVHNELRRSFLGSALTRAVGDTKGVAGLERFGETLTPVIDLWAEPSWAYLRKEWLACGYLSQSAVAGEYSGVALVNPAGSGTILTVEAALVHCLTAQYFYLARLPEASITATYGGGGGRGIARDSRAAPIASVGRAVMWSGTDAARLTVTLSQDVVVTVANVTSYMGLGFPFVLSPGFGLVVEGGAVNITILGGFRWRERLALPGELE